MKTVLKLFGILVIICGCTGISNAKVLSVPGTNTSYYSSHYYNNNHYNQYYNNHYSYNSNAQTYIPFNNYNSNQITSPQKTKTVYLQRYNDYYGQYYFVKTWSY